MKIRRRKYRNGNIGWQLDLGIVDGKRWQRAFATKAEAERCAESMLAERKLHGEAALSMSHEQRLRYAAAERALHEAGVSLEQAVVWAVERGRAVKEHKKLAEVRDLFIAEKERTGCRERTVRQLRVSLAAFVRGREDVRASEVTSEDVKAWRDGNGWSPTTQRNYLADLRGLFRFAIAQRFASQNPTDGVTPAVDRTEKEIAVLAPEAVERLFTTAVTARRRVFDRSANTYSEEHVYRRLLAFAALATFCGVRPEEIKRSGPRALDLDQKVFVVAGSVAKTGKRRVVDLPASALAWLQLWRRLCGEDAPVIPPNFRKLWEGLREAAELKPPGWNTTRKKNSRAESEVAPWPHDVLRHTAASMHYALHQDAAWLKAQLGHVEDEDTLHRNYRAVRLPDGRPINKALAARFWDLRPTATMLAMVD